MNETKKTRKQWSKGARNKVAAGVLVGAGVFGLAVPAAVLAQTNDDPAAQQAQEAPENGQAREGERRGKGLEGLVEEGVLTQEQADALKAAVDPIKENEDLTREEKREQIDAAVNQLVEDGTLTQAQVDQVRESRGRGHHGRRGGHGLETAAETIGVSAEDLRAEIESGKTIAEVAEENNVDPQSVIDALVADKTERIDQAVADERLTEEEAEEKKAEVSERATEIVNNTQEAKQNRPEGPRGRRGPGGPDGEQTNQQGTAAPAFQTA